MKPILLFDTEPLQLLRYSPEKVEKVGLLPFLKQDGVLKFLVAAPNPKNDKDALLPFAIARGTMQMDIDHKGERKTVDVGRWEGEAVILSRETPEDAAVREGEEELGIRKQDIAQLYDCGVLRFTSATKGAYGIHFFLAEMQETLQLVAPEASREVRWIEPREVTRLTKEGVFNSAYVELARAFVDTINILLYK